MWMVWSMAARQHAVGFLGDLPTWITAGATVFALWFARRAAISAGKAASSAKDMLDVERERDHDREAKEDKRRDKKRRAEQADHVAAYPARRSAQSVAQGSATHWCIRVHNSSALPIFGVSVTVHGPPDHVDGPRPRKGLPSIYVVPPGGIDLDWPEDVRPPPEPHRGRQGVVGEWDGHRVAVQFHDTAGHQWLRDEAGQVHHLGWMKTPHPRTGQVHEPD